MHTHAHTRAAGAELNPEEGLGQTEPPGILASRIQDLHFVLLKAAACIWAGPLLRRGCLQGMIREGTGQALALEKHSHPQL